MYRILCARKLSMRLRTFLDSGLSRTGRALWNKNSLITMIKSSFKSIKRTIQISAPSDMRKPEDTGQHLPLPQCSQICKGTSIMTALIYCQVTKVFSYTHIILDTLFSPSHWWSDWKRRRWKGSGQHLVGHLRPPRQRGWVHFPGNIYRHYLNALQTLELLVVRWYCWWEILSKWKGKKVTKNCKDTNNSES